MLSILILLAAQVTPIKPLPKAKPVPMADADAQAVMVPIDALFAGMAARDGAAISAVIRPEGLQTIAVEKPDGTREVRHSTWAAFLDRMKPGPERYEERLLDPAIEVDGDIAMVWSPYIFTVDGKLHHCGVDHFDLVRDSGRWKILNITWSQRTIGCETAK